MADNSREVLAMITPASSARISGIARYAREHGWHLMIQDRLGRRPIEWNGDGIVATIRHDETTDATLRKFRRRRIPIVDMTVDRPELLLPRVTSDHRAIGRLAAEHFRERHFRSVAWFSNSWGNVHRLRYEGLAEGLGFEPGKWIGNDDLIRADKPLAVLTYDETDALVLIRRCLAKHLSVPEEVAVLSIGNDPVMCEMQAITVSSIDQNLELGGYRAAELLDRLMSDRDGHRSCLRTRDESVLIPPKEIITRQSTDVIAISDPLARKAVEYIRRNLSSSFGAAQIAEALGVQRSRLDRAVTAAVGHSVGGEILRQRIAEVKMLLKKTDLPAAVIARKCGFCTPSYLNNVFRRVTGMTPARFRSGIT